MTKKVKVYPGVNIQWPISELIVSGEKVIETRTYPLPEKFIGQEIALIETPGKNGKFKARITAIIKFEESFEYKTKAEFYRDAKKHCVTPNSDWKWDPQKGKWGWPVTVVKKLKKPCAPPRSRGIIFAKNCKVSNV